MAQKHLFFTLTNSKPGEHEEFNRWYNEEHVPDVLKVPPFKAAQRFRLNPVQRVPGPGMEGQKEPPWEYLTIYEVESDDIAAVHQQVADTMHVRTRTDALQPDHQAWVWTPVSDRVESVD